MVGSQGCSDDTSVHNTKTLKCVDTVGNLEWRFARTLHVSVDRVDRIAYACAQDGRTEAKHKAFKTVLVVVNGISVLPAYTLQLHLSSIASREAQYSSVKRNLGRQPLQPCAKGR